MTLSGHQKKYHFPKTDSCNKNAHLFFTFRTQIVFAYFSKKWHFYKERPVFFTNAQKTLFFWAFFEIFFFHFFHVFSFSFSNIKKTKTKSTRFFSKTLSLTPWQTAKKIFSHPYTLFVFFKIPKKYYKTGEKQANKNLGPSFDATLDQVLTQKTPNLGPSFDSTAYIYIYIHRYMTREQVGTKSHEIVWVRENNFLPRKQNQTLTKSP